MRLFINIQIKIFSILFVVIFISYSGKFYAQDITFEPHDTFLYDTLGHEIIFYIDVTNVSKTDQTVFIVRTLDDLPPDWTSSLCFDLCFAPTVDSIATTVDYGSEPLTPGETREVSLHVFTQNNDGTANIQLQAGTFRDPDNRITVDFTATTLLTDVDGEGYNPNKYYLAQNYPNPFNPSTSIFYRLKEAGFVTIKLYDVLGNELTTLVDEYKSAGTFQVNFNNSTFSSGTYFYRLEVNGYSETRKMILEK